MFKIKAKNHIGGFVVRCWLVELEPTNKQTMFLNSKLEK